MFIRKQMFLEGRGPQGIQQPSTHHPHHHHPLHTNDPPDHTIDNTLLAARDELHALNGRESLLGSLVESEKRRFRTLKKEEIASLKEEQRIMRERNERDIRLLAELASIQANIDSTTQTIQASETRRRERILGVYLPPPVNDPPSAIMSALAQDYPDMPPCTAEQAAEVESDDEDPPVVDAAAAVPAVVAAQTVAPTATVAQAVAPTVAAAAAAKKKVLSDSNITLKKSSLSAVRPPATPLKKSTAVAPPRLPRVATLSVPAVPRASPFQVKKV